MGASQVSTQAGGRLARWCFAPALLFVLVAAPSAAQSLDERLFSSVVLLEAKIPGEARTAETLGTERRGSGVVIDDTGLIVTIGYLIVEASEVTVAGTDGKPTPASIVAYDHQTGFGLVRAIQPLVAHAVPLGRSDLLKEDDRALMISRDPDELTSIVQVVSRREFTGSWEYLLENAIFTAPARPYHSGAALIGADGTLLGIGSLIVARASEEVMIPGNMFVPIDALKPVLGDLLAEGRSSKGRQPWLGLSPEEVRGHLFVGRVSPDGPAEKAGLRKGDLILSVAGERADGMADFYRRVWAMGGPGIDVPLDILRGREQRRVVVRSGDRYAWLKMNASH